MVFFVGACGVSVLARDSDMALGAGDKRAPLTSARDVDEAPGLCEKCHEHVVEWQCRNDRIGASSSSQLRDGSGNSVTVPAIANAVALQCAFQVGASLFGCCCRDDLDAHCFSHGDALQLNSAGETAPVDKQSVLTRVDSRGVQRAFGTRHEQCRSKLRL